MTQEQEGPSLDTFLLEISWEVIRILGQASFIIHGLG